MLLRSRKSEAAHRELMLDDPTFFMENFWEMHPLEDNETMDMKRLEECIGKLRDEQRQCIQLFYYEGYGYKEICQEVGFGGEEGEVVYTEWEAEFENMPGVRRKDKG